MHRLIFVSDIHLTEAREDVVTAFSYFLREVPEPSDDLYILGDLFDYWVGDDYETTLTQHFVEQFAKLTKRGTRVFFLHGNRDFALGAQYAEKSGIVILPPFYRVPHMPQLMLLHGDELCINDVHYQRYKKLIRNPFIFSVLKRMPIRLRLALSNRIRKNSQGIEKKIVDTTKSYVEKIFRQYQIKILIHGHTHQPAVHLAAYGTRYVLSEWDKTGDYLILENNEIVRHSITIDSEEVNAYQRKIK